MATKSTGVNKDGKPDMRLKVNKDAAKAKQNPPPTPAPASPKMVTPKVTQPPTPIVKNPNMPKTVSPKLIPQQPSLSPVVKTADKVISTDTKGRTIYEGSRGGHYYINKNGKKEYVKKG